MTDWIEWSGGKCPVPPCTEIEARLRKGTRYITCYPSLDLWWDHSNSPYDIVAYRVVPQNPVPEDTEAKTGVWISTKTTVISEEPKPDMVNHPSHYTDGGIETIDFIRAKLGPDGFRSYCLGNVMKYISRAGKKGDAGEDLKKAKVYLEWAIND